jgi:hypothetical protein
LVFGGGDVAEVAGKQEVVFHFARRAERDLSEAREIKVAATSAAFREIRPTEAEARRNWLLSPYRSSLGNLLVIL